LNSSDFQLLESKYGHLESSWSGGLFSLTLRIATTVLAFWLSSQEAWPVWLVGQIVLGFAMFHWFSILHDCGHLAFLPNRTANIVVGFLASLICFVPYSSWKYVHLEHHQWTGWIDQDPSTRDLLKVTPAKRRLARLAWASYLPAFAFSFLLGTFWNSPKLLSLFKKPAIRVELIFNLVLILAVHISYAVFIGHWWAMFGLGLVFFGVICEPIILSQHVHIPMGQGAEKPQQIPFHEQEKYTRALVFPGWISRYLTLSFENHIGHHFFPWIPSYELYKVKTTTGNEVPAFQWIWAARQVPGDVLVFEDRDATGLQI
jgi:acyl-lipid omega-6 desaturase (Delta-12 desaturase)